MSRSFGALLLATSPSMIRSPWVMSSRPATMFRVVDFPHPDGPTRMMNSPSSIFRLKSSTASAPSGYRLTTWSRTISATGTPSVDVSALDRPGREPGDDPALEEQDDEDERDRDDHC